MSKKIRIVVLQNLSTNKKSLGIWDKEFKNQYPNMFSVILDKELEVEHLIEYIKENSYEDE